MLFLSSSVTFFPALYCTYQLVYMQAKHNHKMNFKQSAPPQSALVRNMHMQLNTCLSREVA